MSDKKKKKEVTLEDIIECGGIMTSGDNEDDPYGSIEGSAGYGNHS
jgi:hypothetical protein